MKFIIWILFQPCFELHLYMSSRSPRVRTQSFTPSICYIYTVCFVQFRALVCLATLPTDSCLICSFCSSDQRFAADFLQIPPHDGHPCLKLCTWHYKPVLGTFTRQIAPMLGALRDSPQSKRFQGLLHLKIVDFNPFSCICLVKFEINS